MNASGMSGLARVHAELSGATAAAQDAAGQAMTADMNLPTLVQCDTITTGLTQQLNQQLEDAGDDFGDTASENVERAGQLLLMIERQDKTVTQAARMVRERLAVALISAEAGGLFGMEISIHMHLDQQDLDGDDLSEEELDDQADALLSTIPLVLHAPGSSVQGVDVQAQHDGDHHLSLYFVSRCTDAERATQWAAQIAREIVMNHPAGTDVCSVDAYAVPV